MFELVIIAHKLKDQDGTNRFFLVDDKFELAPVEEQIESITLDDKSTERNPAEEITVKTATAATTEVVYGIIVNANSAKEALFASLQHLIPLKIENFVLKVSNRIILWAGGFSEINAILDMINSTHGPLKLDSSHQIQICETNEPEFISDEYNPIVKDEDMMIIFVYNGNSKSTVFVEKFAKLSHFSAYLEHISGSVFSVAIGENFDGSIMFQGAPNEDAVIRLIRQLGKKYTSVVYRKDNRVVIEDEFLANPTFKPAFRSKLIGKASSDMRRLIEAIMTVNSSKELHAPLLTIVQSSGSGKSKLACSVSKVLPCTYVVLRDENDSGYPEQSNLSRLFASFRPSTEGNFDEPLEMYGTGYYALLIEAIMKDYKDRLIQFANENIQQPHCPVIMEECIRGEFYGKNLEDFEANRYPSIATISVFANRIKALSLEISQMMPSDYLKTPFVLIVDEAMLLGKGLKMLRRAVHCLGLGSNFVLMTLGTNSDFLDLNPIISTDSHRGDPRKKQFPPFIVSRNSDIFAEDVKAANLKMCPALLRDPRSFLLLVALGRPMWSTIFLENVVSFAKKKLKNGFKDLTPSFLACWLIRTGIKSNPLVVESARHLLKSVMATLLHVTADTKFMSIAYPSEPVLAMAARDLLKEDLCSNYVPYYQALLDYLRVHAVDRGKTGEVLVSDICLQVFEKAPGLELKEGSYKSGMPAFTSADRFLLERHVENLESLCTEYGLVSIFNLDSAGLVYKIISVEGFLTALLGTSYFVKVRPHVPAELLTGIMNFSHFISLNDKFPFQDLLETEQMTRLGQTNLPSVNAKVKKVGVATRKQNSICRELLQIGLNRQAAFLMPDLYYGIDLILPVCLPDPSSEYTESSTLSYISIQVKAGSDNFKSCAEKMDLDYHFIPCTKKNCAGFGVCSRHESLYNMERMKRNQLALVFFLGNNDDNPVDICQPNDSLSAVLINGTRCFETIWDGNKTSMRDIFEKILAFSPMPHDFFKNSPYSSYHRKELLDMYMNKPMYPQFSDVFREEFGWTTVDEALKSEE